MDEYRGYVVARDSRIVRMASAGVGVCVLMLALGTLPARSGGDKVVVCGLAAIAVFLLLGGVFGRLPWFSAARRPQAEAYLSRRGATGGQLSFRQRVVLADDGITVVFGRTPVGPTAREQSRSHGWNGGGLSPRAMACLSRPTRIKEGA